MTDPDGDEISVEGALRWCNDLGVDPEDVVLLPIAYELKSPTVGSFPRKPWTDGWCSLGCDSIPTMQAALPRLCDKLANDPSYFTSVYNYTFGFAKTSGQRSLGVETAIAFWGLLIPHGLTGTALARSSDGDTDDEEDESMDLQEGWKSEFTAWWFEFLTKKGGKGVSRDTWTMVPAPISFPLSPLSPQSPPIFHSSSTSSAPLIPNLRIMIMKVSPLAQIPPLRYFVTESFGPIAAWPSSIDDFVKYVKEEKFGRSAPPTSL